jgi:hypothetical protein
LVIDGFNSQYYDTILNIYGKTTAQISMNSKIRLIIVACCIAAIAAVSYAVFSLFLNKPDYGVEIDAIKVQDLVAISNVRITNTGRLPLTDLVVSMGEGDIQRFDSLEPGKTIWVSPKAQNLISVTLITKEGVVATRHFREPITMVEVGPA